MKRILFVCHGNICRSPMAEFVMKHLVSEAGRDEEFHIESAATSAEELGNAVYPPARRKLAEHGISCAGKTARQMTRADYGRFDLLIGMDAWNRRNMLRICGDDPDQKIHLLMDYTDSPRDVADPWYTGDFDATWRDVLRGCQALLRRLYIMLLLLLPAGAMAQTGFDADFDGTTLRLDYIFGGTAQEADIYFEHAYATTPWAGRRARLTEVPLRGNGQLVMTDRESGRRLFVHTFSTLFQEWQATEEATLLRRAFQASYNVPMPRRAVDVSVTLTDFHNRVVASLTHTVDPADILIRRLGPADVPFHYIWKGQSATAPRRDTANRDFMPTEGPLDGEPDITACIDLAIVAEGYTAAQMGKFYADCQRVADALFAHEPFTSLKGRFNIVAVAAPSAASGPSVPHLSRWADTPTRTHYDTFYSQRYLMTEDMHRLYDLLSGVPFEHVIVLVNSDTYGGGGIYNQLTVSTTDHPTFRQVLVHEFGHAFAGLGDEYFYDDQYDTMYPADTEPWEPNLTTLVDFASKWADLLPPATPVPTPPAPDVPHFRQLRTDADRQRLNEATQRVGVFEGGGYQSHGVYRPAQECRMKINEVELFCPVCSRAISRITDFYTSH